MRIPYFKQLADTNGQDWLESVFDTLETESYDFARFEATAPDQVSLSIDDAIKLDLHDLEIDKAQELAAAGIDDVDAKAVENEGESAAKKISDEQAIAHNSQELAASQDSAASASDEAGNDRDFDNVFERPDVQLNSELMQRHLSDWLALNYPPTSWSAKNSEDAVVVGLTGSFKDLKLSAFDDKIFTAYGDGKVNVDGGDGTDTLYLTNGGLVARLDGHSNFGKFGGIVDFKNVENIVGSDGDDKIFGDENNNKLVGGLGDDTIDGGAGADTITGGSGENNLSGGDGADTITGGRDADVIDGGGSNDKIESGGGDDKVSGGGGEDTIDGGSGDDNISGGDADDDLTGGTGNDEINGDGGNDTIDAGSGNDTVDGGDGDDEIDGGKGDDKIDGGKGDDTLNGDAGNDTINGGDGDDEIDGGTGDDKIDGGTGEDDIDGGDGNDVIVGGSGDDTIAGGKGNDTITGGLGADTMTGGDGNDVFVYLAKEDSGTAADTFDIITDFNATDDKFDLTAVLENDTFDFIAADGGVFTGNGPEVRWDKSGGKTLIEIDVDGNGTADMKIELDDEIDLTAANFSL